MWKAQTAPFYIRNIYHTCGAKLKTLTDLSASLKASIDGTVRHAFFESMSLFTFSQFDAIPILTLEVLRRVLNTFKTICNFLNNKNSIKIKFSLHFNSVYVQSIKGH